MKDQFIVFYISQTKKKMIRFIEEELISAGLGEMIPTHGNVLTVLYNNGGKLKMSEIAELIGKDKSTVTALVNKLMELGYVEKQKDPSDRRISYIHLTERAREIEGAYREISSDVVETAFEGFTGEEKEQFLSLLRRMNRNFD